MIDAAPGHVDLENWVPFLARLLPVQYDAMENVAFCNMVLTLCQFLPTQ
jgi:hypothetical protein